jgi:hypothetical protein
MKKELYLFIIWQNGRFMEKQIASDLKKKFEIFQVFDITWKSQNFVANLDRFYGKKLSKEYKKEKETGYGTFRAYLVYDKSPQISGGKNLAIITCKYNYRQLTGGGNLIYSSDNVAETNENLLFLFGKSLKEVEQEEPHTLPVQYTDDIVGCPCWQSIDQVLEIVKKVPYTRINAYKNSYLIHSKNADLARRILNANSRFKIPGVHKYFIDIGKVKQPIYIRKVGH